MPDDIYRLCSDIVDETVAQIPTLATYLGIPGHDHEWTDYSPSGQDAISDMLRDQFARVEAMPVPDESWGRLAHRVAAQACADDVAWYDAGEHLLELNSISSPVQDIREIFDHMDTSTAEAWVNIAARLETIADPLSGYRELLEAGRRQGMTVARRQVVEAARQARNQASDGSFFETLAASAAGSGVADTATVERIEAAVGPAKSAYDDLAEYLEGTYLPAAGEADGVGEERYVRLARRYLGSDIDPRATSHWGWEEVARLRSSMSDVADEIEPGAICGRSCSSSRPTRNEPPTARRSSAI